MKKKILNRKFVSCAVAILAAIALSVPAFSPDSNLYLAAEPDEGFTKVAESGNFEMYADMKTGHFQINNNSSGAVYYSTFQNSDADEKTPRKDKLAYGSQLIVDYAYVEDFSYVGIINQTNSTVECVNKDTVTVKKIDNGISVEYDFKTYRFSIPVEYTLEDGQLKAKILTRKIKEGKITRIINISLLPSFAYADSNTEGYIFVPDGSGAIINFNSNKQNNRYEAYVYGEELTQEKKEQTVITEKVHMPVFGICKTDNSAVMGNITVGDGSASIKAVSGNDTFGNNICYSQLNYRFVTSYDFLSNAGKEVAIFRIADQQYNLKSYEVSYYLLDANNSDYNALANEYRNYLIDVKGLEKNDVISLINLDTYGALETKANFLGFKYSKLIPLTKYSDIEKIFNSFNDKGINDIAFRYIGWQNAGIVNGNITKNSTPISCLGGNSDLKKLNKFAEENDFEIVYDADLLNYRKGLGDNYSTTAFNKKAYQYEYLRSVYATKISVDSWLLLKPSKITEYANKYLKSVQKRNIENLSLSSATQLIYSDFKKGSQDYRSLFPQYIENLLKSYKKSGISLSGEAANAYTLPYLKTVYDAPTKSSGYKVFDKEIPFYQIVLKGYISMTTAPQQTELNKDDEFLKAVETGSALLFNCISNNQVEIRKTLSEDLYSSMYTLWQDEAIKYYERYNDLYNSVLGKSIVKHYELAENVMKTVFENGISVIVNYNNYSVSAEGNEINAKDFKVFKEGNVK